LRKEEKKEELKERKEKKAWENQSRGEDWSLEILAFGVRGKREKVMFTF